MAPKEEEEHVPLDMEHQLPPLQADAQELERMLDVIEKEIVPLTSEAVGDGNKVFGAAILNDKLETKVIQTNRELISPLFHGEVHAIYAWSSQTPAPDRGAAARDGVFLSTHEPCCMCISSIVWAGFQKVYYLFPYTLTASQGIPHDLNIMHELWGVSTYRKQNKYCSTTCLMDLVQELSDEDPLKQKLQATLARLVAVYDALSNQYHTEKADNTSNSLAFG
jgi:tRNA(Arg) A34 adenosine deaminase TadA